MRHGAGPRDGFVRHDGRRAVSGGIEQGGERFILPRQRQHRRPPVFRAFAAQADGGINEIAHGAAVLRPGIASRLEIARDERVRGRTAFARGGNDVVEQINRCLNAGGGRHGSLLIRSRGWGGSSPLPHPTTR